MRRDQKRIFKLISRGEALERTLSFVERRVLGDEIVAVDESCGRIFAEDVRALHDLPLFNRASMDGYAVRSRDTASASAAMPVRLTIVGKLFPADASSARKILKGECIYTSTGAPLPESADAVAQVERTRLADGAIEVVRPLTANENVSVRGQEVKEGEKVFEQGEVVAPQNIGMLLSLGIRRVRVVRKPRVEIISVGDELTEAHQESQERLVNDHAYIVSELLGQLGAEPRISGIVPDDPERIKAKISDALETADIVVTIAGSSVGAKDFVPDVVESLGKIMFHGIAMTPGKVTGVAVANGKPVMMLPGYLMSVLAGFYTFVAPVVNLLGGLDVNGGLPVVEAKLKQSARTKHGMERFLLLHLLRHGNSYLATPVEPQLGAMAHLNKANGYTIVSKDRVLRKGDRVKVTLFAPSEFRRIAAET